MELHLRNKVFIVSGGAKGIGRAITIELVREGSSVIIIDKDDSAGQDLVKQFPAIHFIKADLNSADACWNAVDEVVRKHKQLDGLINNAGFNDSVGLESGNPQRFLESLTQNAGHYYYLAHFCLPHLKKSRGSILNIASKVAITGQGGTSGYAAAKGAILALTREWAVELLPFSIRVNAIVPSEVWTPLYESWIGKFPDPASKKKTIEDKIPLDKRMTLPEEIAAMAAFVLSDRGGHVTGQWLHVDGGYVHLDRAIS